MLRIANPLGKAFMVTNPAKRGGGRSNGNPSLGESSMLRIYNRRRSHRKRNAGAGVMSADVMSAEQGAPSSILPKIKDLGGIVGTVGVGTVLFMANNAVGVGIDKVITNFNLDAQQKGLVQGLKFAGRYLTARGVASLAFTQSKGFLSRRNGAFLVTMSLLTGGFALLREFGLFEKLPEALQPYIPKLSAYESGVQRSNLSGYRRRLSAYESGIQRGQLSAYTQGIKKSQLSANFDNMPVEQMEVPNYGVPFGA